MAENREDMGASQATGLSQAEPPEGLGPSGFDPSRVGKMEFDHEFVRCPMCGETAGDCWEWVRDEPRPYKCGGCGGSLSVWSEVEVTYYTFAVDPPCVSDGSPKGGDGEAGSVACDDSAGRNAASPQGGPNV